MEGTSLPQLRNEEFWQKVILVVTESERRKFAMAQFIIELFSSVFNVPGKYPLEEKFTRSSTKKENKLEKTKKDEIERITELDFIRRKWEMDAKSKL